MSIEDFVLWRFDEVYNGICETEIRSIIENFGVKLSQQEEWILKVLSPAKKSSEWVNVSKGVSCRRNYFVDMFWDLIWDNLKQASNVKSNAFDEYALVLVLRSSVSFLREDL